MLIHKDDSLTDKNVVDSARLLLAHKARELLRKENSWIAYLPVAKKKKKERERERKKKKKEERRVHPRTCLFWQFVVLCNPDGFVCLLL